MSKRTFCKILAFSILGLVLILKSGLVYVRFPPLASYKLNNVENKVLSDALAEFRENLQVDPWGSKVFLDETEFGKPLSSELLGVSYPDSEKTVVKGLTGIIYSIAYVTKTDKTEIVEHFQWIVCDNAEIKLVSYRVTPMKTTYRTAIENRRILSEKYSNQMIINLGNFLGPVEIRY
jgi:hypothetical protein